MVDPVELSESVSFSVTFGSAEQDRPVGFDKHGIRRNYSSDDEEEDEYLESIDVIFAAMEPGERKGFNITEPFLRNVARNFSDPVPMQLDHDENQLSNVGSIHTARFSDGFLRLIGNIPNTGNSVKSDVIADFTHDPPAIRDGSVGFGSDITIQQNEEGTPEFVDATMAEFSLTPFPAGYDDRGGLSPQFRKAARDAGVFEEDAAKQGPARSHLKGESRVRFHQI